MFRHTYRMFCLSCSCQEEAIRHNIHGTYKTPSLFNALSFIWANTSHSLPYLPAFLDRKLLWIFPFHKSVTESTVSETNMQMLDMWEPCLYWKLAITQEISFLYCKLKKKHLAYSDLCIYAHVRSHLSHLKADYKSLFNGDICTNCLLLKGP